MFVIIINSTIIDTVKRWGVSPQTFSIVMEFTEYGEKHWDTKAKSKWWLLNSQESGRKYNSLGSTVTKPLRNFKVSMRYPCTPWSFSSLVRSWIGSKAYACTVFEVRKFQFGVKGKEQLGSECSESAPEKRNHPSGLRYHCVHLRWRAGRAIR